MSRHVQQLMAAQLAMSTESLVADATQLDTYLEEAAGACAALESIDLSLAALADGNVTTAAIESHVDAFLAEQNLTVSNEGVADKLKAAGAAVWKKLKELIAWIVDLFKKLAAKVSAWVNSLKPAVKKLRLKAKDFAGKGGEVTFQVSQETANWVRDPKAVGRSFLILAPGKTALAGLCEGSEKLAEAMGRLWERNEGTAEVIADSVARSGQDWPKDTQHTRKAWDQGGNAHYVTAALNIITTHYHGKLLPVDAYQNYQLASDAPDTDVDLGENIRIVNQSLKIQPSFADAYASTEYKVPVSRVVAALDEVEKHLGPWEAEINQINAKMEQSLKKMKDIVAAPTHEYSYFTQNWGRAATSAMQLIQKLSHTVQVGILAQRSFTEHHIKWLNAAFAAAK